MSAQITTLKTTCYDAHDRGPAVVYVMVVPFDIHYVFNNVFSHCYECFLVLTIYCFVVRCCAATTAVVVVAVVAGVAVVGFGHVSCCVLYCHCCFCVIDDSYSHEWYDIGGGSVVVSVVFVVVVVCC